jgi:hypothetical protein
LIWLNSRLIALANVIKISRKLAYTAIFDDDECQRRSRQMPFAEGRKTAAPKGWPEQMKIFLKTIGLRS